MKPAVTQGDTRNPGGKRGGNHGRRKRPRAQPFDAGGSAPTNRISVTLVINVDLRSLASWPPATLKAFMQGIGQVISADAEARR